MLTRRCNSNCPGCGVIKYPYYEMSTYDCMRTLDVLRNSNIEFVSLYGGEPTLRDDLPEIVSYANDSNLNYSIITNSIRLLREDYFYDKLLKVKPKSITCSVGMHNDGLQLLEKLSNDNEYDGELVATLMIHKGTVDKIPGIISKLSSMEIKSLLFFLHTGNGSNWHYRGSINNVFYQINQNDISNLVGILLKDYDKFKILNSRSYIESWKKYGIKLNWKCSGLTSLHINSDGKLSVCQDKPPLNYSIFDLPGAEEEIIAICNEQAKNCSGCFYDCYYEHDNKERLCQK